VGGDVMEKKRDPRSYTGVGKDTRAASPPTDGTEKTKGGWTHRVWDHRSTPGRLELKSNTHLRGNRKRGAKASVVVRC